MSNASNAGNAQWGAAAGTKPILVSGVYRSGTTFLAALLGAHPDLRASSSTVKFIRFCLGRYGDMANAADRRRLVEESARRVLVRWELTMDVESVLREADAHAAPSYALMYDLMMKDLLCKGAPARTRWVEKLAIQWSGIPAFLDMFPEGRVVHVVRDPRDVVLSYKKMTFEPGHTYIDAAFNCRDSMASVLDLPPQYASRVFVVRAEDLATQREAKVEELWKFLGLQPDGSMLDVEKLHAEGEDWATNTSFGKPFQKWPDAKPRWPEHLSRVEVMLIEMLTQPYLGRYGYESSGFVPTAAEWGEMYAFLDDEFLQGRFRQWLTTGKGAEGYRSDPYTHEMRIVFPDRFGEPAEAGAA